MIRGLKSKLQAINDAILEFEKDPSPSKGEEINSLFHTVIHLLEGHELSIDDAMEVQMVVNRWSNVTRSKGITAYNKELAILKEMVNAL